MPPHAHKVDLASTRDESRADDLVTTRAKQAGGGPLAGPA